MVLELMILYILVVRILREKTKKLQKVFKKTIIFL